MLQSMSRFWSRTVIFFSDASRKRRMFRRISNGSLWMAEGWHWACCSSDKVAKHVASSELVKTGAVRKVVMAVMTGALLFVSGG